jgi:hypothetical protein
MFYIVKRNTFDPSLMESKKANVRQSLIILKRTGKAVPAHAMNAYIWMNIGGGEWSAQRLGRFTVVESASDT